MNTPSLIQPGQDLVLKAFGAEARFHLTGAQTEGRYTMFTEVTPPGGGPPPHVHANQDEWFHVLEGRVAFFLDNQWTEAGVGVSAFIPRGTPHTFKNVGDVPLKLLIHVAPAGFEDFYAEAAAEFARPEGPDMNRTMEIASRHGIQILAP